MRFLSSGCLALAALVSAASAVNINVQSTTTVAIPETLYGMMYEDINHSGDGGLYAELLQNRAFQKTTALTGWEVTNNVSLSVVTSGGVSTALPNNLAVSIPSGSSGAVGFRNTGYWGIRVQSGWTYTGSLYAKSSTYRGSVTVRLRGASSGTVYASAVAATNVTASWTKYTFSFAPTTSAPDTNNVFDVVLQANGTATVVNFGLFTLFPPTYKNRPNGLRIDLAETLAAITPKVWRFPGGNNLEGESIDQRWKWNETIGPLENRPGRLGDWGYINTDGLGLMEYLQWAEDLDATVILGVWAGFSLNGAAVPQNQLQPYINEVLNELHFLLDDSTTTWGALRASYGRTAPYIIPYVEIGNEDFLTSPAPTYGYRWTAYYNAIHAAFPNLKIMSTSYPTTSLDPSYSHVDVHDYNYPAHFTGLANQYDTYSRSAAQVFVGEYAVISTNASDIWNHRLAYPVMTGAASEAAYLTGLERNSDVVFATAYAPLLQHVSGTQWTPNLVTFDAKTVVRSVSYWVQQLFGAYRGTHVLNSGSGTSNPVYWVSSIDRNTGTIYIKLANAAGSSQTAAITLASALGLSTSATVRTISSPDPNASNTINTPDAHVPQVSTVTVTRGTSLNLTLGPYSATVVVIPKSGVTSSSTSTTNTGPTSSPGNGCTVPRWGQCGGQGYSGCTACATGSTCTYSNDWYSQCT